MIAISGEVIAASAATLSALVTKDLSGTAIVQADISTIVVKVYDRKAGTQVGADYTPAVSACVLDTIETDANGGQYNLAIDLAGTYWPTGDTNYRAEAKLTPVSGNPYYVLWDLQAKRIYSE